MNLPRIIYIYLFLSLVIYSCKSSSLPSHLPKDAKYDRRTNVYIVVKENQLLKYNKDGFLFDRCQINEQGILDGYCEGYLIGTSQVIKKGNFKNGQRDGLWIWYFENGSIYIEQEYSYGKKREFWLPVEEWGNENGLYRRFYPEGFLEEQGYFESGYRSGSWIKYYPNGKLEYKGSYKKGVKVNTWNYYYPNGSIEANEIYTSKGELILRETYYPNGKLWCKISKDEKPICNTL